jgi:hypothetical protein
MRTLPSDGGDFKRNEASGEHWSRLPDHERLSTMLVDVESQVDSRCFWRDRQRSGLLDGAVLARNRRGADNGASSAICGGVGRTQARLSFPIRRRPNQRLPDERVGREAPRRGKEGEQLHAATLQATLSMTGRNLWHKGSWMIDKRRQK